MSKVNIEYENPIDNIYYGLAESLNPYFHNMNFTPNGITTLSLLFGLAACCSLYNKQFIPFAIMYLISYYLDFMDGAYARKYKMISEFGDWYDHIKDVTVMLILLSILHYKFNLFKHKELVSILVISCFLTGVHLGCQEKMYGKNESDSLSMYKKMCPAHTREELEQIMPYTRFFGTGTPNLVQITVAYLLLKG